MAKMRRHGTAQASAGSVQEPSHAPSVGQGVEPTLEQPAEQGASDLGPRLLARVQDVDDPPDASALHALATAHSIAERGELVAQTGFWCGSAWEGAAVEAGRVRRLVDPLGELPAWMAGLPDPVGRARVLSHVLAQVPGGRERLLSDASLREAVLQGLDAVGRLRVLHAISQPEAPLDDPYLALQLAVGSGDASVLRQAWATAHADPAVGLRLARDLELRQRIVRLSPELGEQIAWELDERLSHGGQDGLEGIYDAAARPALRVLGALMETRWLGGPDQQELVDAVRAYLQEAHARVRAQAEGGAEVGEFAREHALRALGQRFADYHGESIAQALAARYPTFSRLAAVLGVEASVGRASSSPDREGAGWEEAARRRARHHATLLHQVRDGSGGFLGLGGQDAGTAILGALESARTDLRSVVGEGEGASAADVELRVTQALSWVGRAYEALYGPLGGLLAGVEDPGQLARAEALLGEKVDRVAEATQGVLRGLHDQSRPDGRRRDQLLVGMARHCRTLGGELAERVQDEDGSGALSAAREFFESTQQLMDSGALAMDEGDLFVPILEAAYAPIGGSLRGGVATLDNSDKVFRALRMHSTGAALREAGDERSDDVLGAEYKVDERLSVVFEAVVAGDSSGVSKALDTARTAHTTLRAADPSLPEFHPYVAHRYRDLHGIPLVGHIRRSRLPAGFRRELGAEWGDHADQVQVDELAGPDVVSPEFFQLDGQVPSGIDSTAVSDPAMIERMTDLHVVRLGTLAQEVSGAGGARDLRVAVAHLTFCEGLERVERRFTLRYGATLDFFVRESAAAGRLSGEQAAGLQTSLDAEELSALARRLRTYADEGSWSQALELSESTPLDQRAEVLTDHATMAYLRERADTPIAWRTLFDSLNGQLQVEDLLQQETDTQDFVESFGYAWSFANVFNWASLATTGVDLHEVVFGVDEAEQDFDVAGILGARRERMGVQAGAADAAATTVDGDALALLGQTQGTGGGWLDGLASLATGAKDESKAKVDQRQQLGAQGKGLTQAARSDRDWMLQLDGLWQLDELKEAILAMSDTEREQASRDTVFLERLTRLTKDDPHAGDELFALLFDGKKAGEAGRIHSMGTGVEWSAFRDPWEAMEAFNALSVEEQAEIALDPVQRQSWVLATAGEPQAQKAMLDAIDAAEGALGARWEQESGEESGAEEVTGAESPRSQAGRAAFLARADARMVTALNNTDNPAKALVEAAASIAAEARAQARDLSKPGKAVAKDGWAIKPAMIQVWMTWATEIQEAFSNMSMVLNEDDSRQSLEERGEAGYDRRAFSELFITSTDEQVHETLMQWHTEGLGAGAVRRFRTAGSDRDVPAMVAAVKGMRLDELARSLTNLRHPGLGGVQPMSVVYSEFRRARRAADRAAEQDGAGEDEVVSPEVATLRADQTLAAEVVRNHPIVVREGAGLSLPDMNGSNVALGEFSGAEQQQILGAIRARMQKLDGKTVGQVLNADEADQELLWSGARQAHAMVAGSREDSRRSLEYDLVGIGLLTKADDQAASRFLSLAQGFERVTQDDTLSDEEKETLEELKGEFDVSLKEFQAAKDKVAKTVSTAANGIITAAVGGIITAATGGAGAPIAAALITTALAGGADVLINELIKGDDYEADDGLAQVGVDVLKASFTAHMGKLWTASKASMLDSLAKGPSGRKLLLLGDALERKGKAYFGQLGMDVGGLALDAGTSAVSDTALTLLDPAMFEHGWDDGLQKALDKLESELKAAPAAFFDSLLDHLAAQAGKAASGAVSKKKAASVGARELGADDPKAPDKKTEPKKYREYLVERLKKIPGAAGTKALEGAVSGLTREGLREGQEFVVSGDTSLDYGSMVKGTRKGAMKGVKAGQKDLFQAFTGARKDRLADIEKAEREPGHADRMEALASMNDHGLSEAELRHYKTWASKRHFAPTGEDAGVELAALSTRQRLRLLGESRDDADGARSEASGRKGSARQVSGPLALVERQDAVRREIEAFRREVLAPLEGKLERQRRTWGQELDDQDLATFEQWVREEPDKATSRADVNPVDFMRRRKKAADVLARERSSPGYASLSDTEKAWFDQACKRPELLSDMGQDKTQVAISVKDDKAVARFRKQLDAVQESVGAGLVYELSQALADDRKREWATEQRSAIAKGVELHPSDKAGNQARLRARLEERWQEHLRQEWQEGAGTEPLADLSRPMPAQAAAPAG